MALVDTDVVASEFVGVRKLMVGGDILWMLTCGTSLASEKFLAFRCCIDGR